jgi:sugar phosphate permease
MDHLALLLEPQRFKSAYTLSTFKTCASSYSQLVPIRFSSALSVFWSLTLAYFLSYFFRSANAVIAPDLTSALQLSSTDLGLMTAVFYLAFAGGQLPIGWAFDRFGVRFVQPVLLGVAALGALLFSAAESVWIAALARGLLGLGLAGCLMAAFKAFAVWFPPERQATVTGYLMALGVLGALGAASPLAWLSNLTGWRSVFVYGAGLTVFSALLILIFVRNAPTRDRIPRDSPTRANTSRDTIPQDQSPQAATFNFLEPKLLRIALVNLFAAGGLLSIQTLWGGKFLFDAYGLEKGDVGALLTVLNLGVFCGYMLIGWLADRFGLAKVALTGLSAFVVCIALLAAQVPLPFLYAVYFAFGVFGTSNLLLLSHARRLYPASLTGRATTFVNMFGIGGTFALQSLIGVAVSGSSSIAYTLAFGCLAVGLLVTLLIYAPVAFTLEPSLQLELPE